MRTILPAPKPRDENSVTSAPAGARPRVCGSGHGFSWLLPVVFLAWQASGCAVTGADGPSTDVLDASSDEEYYREQARRRQAALGALTKRPEPQVPERKSSTSNETESAPKYLPCVQGSEMLRFFDNSDARREVTGDEAAEVIAKLPPVIQRRVLRNMDELLKQLDQTARTGAHSNEVLKADWPSFREDTAEAYITDCSDQLGRLSALAALSDLDAAAAIVQLWQSNLEFMKWWLENSRQKHRTMK